MNTLYQTVLTSLLIILICIGLLLIRKKLVRSWRAVALFSLLFIVNDLISQGGLLLQRKWMPELEWNWTGKILSLLISIVFVLVYKKLSWREVVGSTKMNRQIFFYCLTVFAALLITKVIPNYLSSEKELITNEQLIFQATIPGLQEEFLFRGLYLAFLVQAIVPVAAGSKSRWFHLDVMVLSLAFGLVHSLSVGGETQFISFNMLAFGSAFVSGLCYMWLRLISRSIIVPVIAHNLINVSICLVQMMK